MLYEIKRSYMVTRVASIEANSAEEAVEIAKAGDVCWKEYGGDYLPECDYDCEENGE